MKILLIYANRVKYPKDISLGLAYISSVLKQNGHEVELIDTTFGISDKNVRKKVRLSDPGLIGISSTSPNFKYAVHLGHLIREEIYSPIIVGGIHPTIDPEATLSHSCFDMICIGEGEHAMVQLANSIEHGEHNLEIKNIWFKKGERFIKNASAGSIPFLVEIM